MKKIDYILSIFLALLFTVSIYSQLSGGKPITNTLALAIFFIITLLAGSIGGILKRVGAKRLLW